MSHENPVVTQVQRPKRKELRKAQQAKKRRSIWMIATSALALMVLIITGGAIAVASGSHDIKLTVDGKTSTLSSRADNVSELLKELQIKLGEHDKLNPQAETELKDGLAVNLKTAVKLKLLVDGQEQEIWTTEDSVAKAIATLNYQDKITVINAEDLGEKPDTNKEIRSTNASGSVKVQEAGVESEKTKSANKKKNETENSEPAQRELSLVDSGSKVEFQADGKTQEIAVDKACDLQDLANKAQIQIGKDDEVTSFFDTNKTLQISVARIGQSVLKETKEIPFETQNLNDENKFRDEKTVITPGQKGMKEVETRVKTRDGVIVESEVLSEKVLQAPVTQKVSVGTKTRPPSPAGSDVWAKLAKCECGGNASCNTGNGYYGMYQFSLPTWRSVGGTGLPSEASAEEQTMRAQILQKRSGWGQWPACTRKLGLR